ncbi:MAG: hypothetical protein ACM3VV_03575 [Deltaproteobacteria bacterium]
MSSTTNTNPYSDSAVCACTSPIINDDREDIAANVPANNTIIKNIVLIFVVLAFTLVNI